MSVFTKKRILEALKFEQQLGHWPWDHRDCGPTRSTPIFRPIESEGPSASLKYDMEPDPITGRPRPRKKEA